MENTYFIPLAFEYAFINSHWKLLVKKLEALSETFLTSLRQDWWVDQLIGGAVAEEDLGEGVDDESENEITAMQQVAILFVAMGQETSGDLMKFLI